MKFNQRGVSIVELVVVISLISMLLSVVMGISLYMFISTSKIHAEAELIVESQNILRIMTEDIRTAEAILNYNTLTDSNEPGGGWQSDVNSTLIVAAPAVDANGNFVKDTENSGYYYDENIFYRDGTQLLKRTLANPLVSGNPEKTSCPSAISSESCPPDANYSSNILNDISITYYDQDNGLISGSDYSGARSVEISVTVSKSVFGQLIQVSNAHRMTLRNLIP